MKDTKNKKENKKSLGPWLKKAHKYIKNILNDETKTNEKEGTLEENNNHAKLVQVLDGQAPFLFTKSKITEISTLNKDIKSIFSLLFHYLLSGEFQDNDTNEIITKLEDYLNELLNINYRDEQEEGAEKVEEKALNETINILESAITDCNSIKELQNYLLDKRKSIIEPIGNDNGKGKYIDEDRRLFHRLWNINFIENKA